MIESLAVAGSQSTPAAYKRNKTAATPASLFSFVFWVSPAKHGEGRRGSRHLKANPHTTTANRMEAAPC